ncbi:hypothetical protein TGARI_294585 [Toxoplasma gondii ARI]|uniref:Uncharacterized protein n=1 Tax=Toxoplasma gondii ARI TaxID=1074872 RepID=A0A139XLR5_TOXGO|nr:hypothetical protein TGARI_294585 [Toxoplasma gondii ARI]
MKSANSHHTSRHLPPPLQVTGFSTTGNFSPRLSPDFMSLPSSPSASSTYSSADEELHLSQKDGVEQSLRPLLPPLKDNEFLGFCGVQAGALVSPSSRWQPASTAGGSSNGEDGRQVVLRSTDVDEGSAVQDKSKGNCPFESHATDRYFASMESSSSRATNAVGFADHSSPTLLEGPLSAAAKAVAAFGIWKEKGSHFHGEGNGSSANLTKEENPHDQHPDEGLSCAHNSGTQASQLGRPDLTHGQGDLSKHPPLENKLESLTSQKLRLELNRDGTSSITTCGLQGGFTSAHPTEPLLSGSPDGLGRHEEVKPEGHSALNWVDAAVSKTLEASENMLRPGFAGTSELLNHCVAMPPQLPSGSIRSRAEEELSLLVEDQWRLLAGSNGWEDIFTSVQHKAVLRYQRLWHILQSVARCDSATAAATQGIGEESETTTALGLDRFVLLYAIPAFRREGGRNRKWRICKVHYFVEDLQSTTNVSPVHEAESDTVKFEGSTTVGEWHNQQMIFIMEDPCNADALFTGVFFVPKTKRLRCCFFTDGDSDDADFPAQVAPGGIHPAGTGSRYNSVEWPSNEVPTEFYSRFRGRWCYCFPPGASVTTIRDGEVADVDKITTTGVTLRLDHELLKSEEWSGGSLLYMVEHAGSWVEKQFSELDGSVSLTEQRSVTFVVKSKNGQNYLHATGGGNMRVAFPGAYVICPNGRVVECALTTSAHTPMHQQHEALVTQLIRQLKSKGITLQSSVTQRFALISPSENHSRKAATALHATEAWRLQNRPQMFNIHTPSESECDE